MAACAIRQPLRWCSKICRNASGWGGRSLWVNGGMVTIQNLALLRQRGQGYLVGLKRRRNEQVDRYIQAAAQGPWQECPVGITALEREKVPRTMVTEVAGEEPGVRVFVVQSEERLAYERGMREA